MKKARTPLAIWLALILTLTLFPTALAEPTEPSTTPQMATITFDNGDAPDGVTVPSLIEKEVGAKYHIAEGTVPGTWEGHTFLGWVSSANPGKLLQPGDNIAKVPEGGLTLTAQWEEAKTPDDGTDSESDNGETSTPPNNDNDPNSPSGGTGTPLAETVNIDYTGAGSPVDKMDVTWSKGTKYTIAGAPSNPGYNFKGWKDTKTGTIYDPGAEITPTEDITLETFWVQNVEVTYNEGSTFNKKYPDVGAYIIEKPTVTPSDKIFTGWLSNDNKIYQPGTEITLTANAPLILTAQYAGKITVQFAKENNSGKVSGMPLNTEVPADQKYQLPTKEPSRTDGSYEFGRWRLNFNGKTYTYSAGATINWASIGVDAGDTVTFIADFDHHTYPDRGDDDDRPSKPSKPTYDEYRIRATCSDGGWVSPAGSSYVREGRNLTVTFAPWNGYAIDGVYIDGVLDNRYDGSYTFRDVDENHTIYVRYVRDSGSSGGSSGGGSHWDDDTSPKTGDASAPLSMGLGVGSLALIAFLVARKMRRA